MQVKFLVALMFVVSFRTGAGAQNTRLSDRNTIGWYVVFGNAMISGKWSAQLEYQWRRNNLITDWQQSLLRGGLGYQLTDRVQLRAGYAYIQTFAYGDFPLQSAGKNFPEHRIFQSFILADKIKSLELTHRIMLEQRFTGRYTSTASAVPDEFVFTGRARYLLRLQHPLSFVNRKKASLYAAASNEVFIGFGRNAGENIFDQNRMACLIGYKPGKAFRMEGGFISQTLQLGREVSNRNVFQYNKGVVLNLYVTVGS